MKLNQLSPGKALNKAFLKVKVSRDEIDRFKSQFALLLKNIKETEKEHEEYYKNLVSDFLKRTYYDPDYFINIKKHNDLVIRNGKNVKNSVGVIIEAKKPDNKAEMLKQDSLNAKAFHELILYYLRERISGNNSEIRHLIATNIHEWYIFDAEVFEKAFAQNRELTEKFRDFEDKKFTDNSTDYFYREIARPAVEEIKTEIEFTYIDISEYEKLLKSDEKEDANRLIRLFKLLSPVHLLKLPFSNDSNTLDKKFYAELLHIIGLTETKDGGKKLIERKKEGERDPGSLLENTVKELEDQNKISLSENPEQFGDTEQDRLFNTGLELSITWMNRLLFLKLLEAQLLTYHKGDKSYFFLNYNKIRDFNVLNTLFFDVLAKTADTRNENVKQNFEKVPYLNSSLFDRTELEKQTLLISDLKSEKELPLLKSTVLKDKNGKQLTGELNTLEYIFRFLDSYDFASEGAEEIQEERKSLISASVLGLIFEKINGYKDGSFFTPGFITMYMCSETIRRAVVQKFDEIKGWNCKEFDDLKDKIDTDKDNRKEANEIVNSLKICDPRLGQDIF